jgi:DNA-binding transcriptional regulator YiaG
MKCIRCGKGTVRSLATRRSPHHFVESGLRNIYLAGIEIYTCRACGSVHPVIPKISGLHKAIAQQLTIKNGPLQGEEIRFLRKAAGFSAINYASLLMIDPATLSRAENGHQSLSPSLDKLARAVAIESINPGMAKRILASLIDKIKTSAAPLPLFNYDTTWEVAA